MSSEWKNSEHPQKNGWNPASFRCDQRGSENSIHLSFSFHYFILDLHAGMPKDWRCIIPLPSLSASPHHCSLHSHLVVVAGTRLHPNTVLQVILDKFVDFVDESDDFVQFLLDVVGDGFAL